VLKRLFFALVFLFDESETVIIKDGEPEPNQGHAEIVSRMPFTIVETWPKKKSSIIIVWIFEEESNEASTVSLSLLCKTYQMKRS
jgi:hypothetical protein